MTGTREAGRGEGALRTLRRAVARLRAEQAMDRAAALTYYGVLALFPGLLVLVALIGLFGSHPATTDTLLDLIARVGPESAVDTFRGTVEGVVRGRGGAGALLGVGILGAIWSASGYVGAFMRAANALYGVPETRPFWRLRPLQVVATVAAIVLLAAVLAALTLTGGVARAVGEEIGVGGTAVTLWDALKWPVLLLVVAGLTTALYRVSPDVPGRRTRDMLPGAAAAVGVWLVASAGFAAYVANFGSYDATYGALGGVIVFLVWLWLTNLAGLFGLALNAERARPAPPPPPPPPP
ncbi:MAG: YihY/virulence factor BrkB family protein, partial [Actinomycetota bacterium]